MDARPRPPARFACAGTRSHQEARRLLRAIKVRASCPCGFSRESEPEALARLVGWSMTLEALATRLRCSQCGKEGRGGRGRSEARTERHPKESALAPETRPGTCPGSLFQYRAPASFLLRRLMRPSPARPTASSETVAGSETGTWPERTAKTSPVKPSSLRISRPPGVS